MAGWARIQVSGPRGTRVVMKFGEMLLDDGTIDQTNLFLATATDTYILNGKGTESWEPRFTYHGFRYVQVEASLENRLSIPYRKGRTLFRRAIRND